MPYAVFAAELYELGCVSSCWMELGSSIGWNLLCGAVLFDAFAETYGIICVGVVEDS